MSKQFRTKEYPCVNTTWSRMLNDFVLSGGLRDLRESEVKTWLIIRAHTDLYNGTSFPSASQIAKLADHSEKTSRRALKVLRERDMPLVRAVPRGRGYEYTLIDYLRVETEPGKFEQIEFDYIPSLMEKLLKKIDRKLKEHRNGSVFNFGDITININVHNGDIHLQMTPDTDVQCSREKADMGGEQTS